MCHKMSCQMLKTSGWYEENLQVMNASKKRYDLENFREQNCEHSPEI